MKRYSPILVALVVGCGSAARADTIQPTSGAEITGTVTKYANNSFEVRAAGGQTRTVSANSVKRIDFENRTTPVKVTSRTKGALEGSIASFENGGFNFTGPNGAEKLSLIFVDRITFAAERGAAVDVIAKGNQVDVTRHLAPGLVTIIDYYADWCGPCKQISPVLEQIVRSDPEVALRKVDIVNWESAVVKQYKISSIPRIEIYNRTGKLVGTAGTSPEEVRRYVAQAKL
ncbi:MAG TPA: thioredoxin family protein [Chthoniobacterales bacterium]|jgi:thiol-disulfide isomerase/thioredoxin